MKRIIILKGTSNVGKTSTLSALIGKLLAKDSLMVYPEQSSGIPSFAIVELEKHKIGIITFGDPTSETDVKSCLNQCLENDCDIIFAASRTRGNVYDILYHFAKTNHFATIETSPLYAWKYEETGMISNKLNESFAEILVSII